MSYEMILRLTVFLGLFAVFAALEALVLNPSVAPERAKVASADAMDRVRALMVPPDWDTV